MYPHSTLHLFNPSHDEALAAHSPYYSPSKIAQKLASQWALLPSLWANDGDAVYIPTDVKCLVDTDVLQVNGRQIRLVQRSNMTPRFWQTISQVQPWGWDAMVKHQLVKMNAPTELLPTDDALEQIRQLSSRQTTADVLPMLVDELKDKVTLQVVGRSHIVHGWEELMLLVATYGSVMVKSLWSCSGRGVFVVNAHPSPSVAGRVCKLLQQQGAIEVEPLYKGVADFALEFDVDAGKGVCYRGLSLFRTTDRGGYMANVVQPQEQLQAHLFSMFQPLQMCFKQLCSVCEQVLSAHFMTTAYSGPLGIDMMLVQLPNGTTALHPCIEVNVRRTMGYVACQLQSLGVEAWQTDFPFSKDF